MGSNIDLTDVIAKPLQIQYQSAFYHAMNLFGNERTGNPIVGDRILLSQSDIKRKS
jgi:hypothetical protein